MKLSKYPIINYLFFTAIIGMIASISYLSYSSLKLNNFKPPGLMAYSKEHGFVFNIERSLYHTDTQGKYISSNSFEDMNLSIIGDIEFVEDKLYISQGGKKNIMRCSLNLNNCKEIAKINDLTLNEAIDIAITPDKKNFYITASFKHKIDYFTIDGDYLYELNLKESMKYPNGIISLGGGNIIVADTNNHRVIGINHKYSNAKVIWNYSVKNEFYRKGYKWPINIGISNDNNIWTLNSGGLFESGDIVIYEKIDNDFNSSKPKAIKRIEIFENEFSNQINPFEIVNVEDEMVICDMANYDIYRVSSDGNSYSKFGDYYIQEILNKYRSQKEVYQSEEFLSQIFIGIFIAMLIFIFIFEFIKAEDKSSLFTKIESVEENINTDNVELIDADENGIIWLKMNSKMVKQFKMLGYAMLAMLTLLSTMLIYLVGINKELMLPLGGIILIITPVCIFIIFGFNKQKLGIKCNNIYIINFMGKEQSDNINSVVFTGKRILLKNVAISIMDGHGNMLYDKTQLQKYILSKFSEINNINEFQLFIRNIFRFDIKTWLMTFASIVLLVATFWIVVFG